MYGSLLAYLKAFTFVQTDIDLVLLYQTILTIVQIYPEETLINLALEKLELILNNSFLKKNNSLLLVLEAISKFADLDRKYLLNYQVLLLECLESEDETIKHMSIRILFKNVHESNLELVI